MPITVNTNIMSLNAQRNMTLNSNMLSKSLEKLASGYRINRAGDDAAGLAVSENLRAQIRGSKKALDNVQDGTNMLNIADGAFGTIQDNLQRIRELVVQAANETYSQAQRTALNQEIDQLRSDIDRIANSTQFNGITLATTAVPANFFVQIGANSNATNDRLDIVTALGDIRATVATGLNLVTAASANITSNATAQTFLGVVDTALTTLNTRRANLGAFSNRLESAASNLANGIENLSASESRIRNVDVASESAEMMRYQILQQASASILGQANQGPQLALKLLG